MENTYIRKDIRGNWKAETAVDLTDELVFTMSTSKLSTGTLSTLASVSHRKNGMLTHMMYQDYSRNLERTRYPRITSKVVTTQHTDWYLRLEDYLNEARAFYQLEVIYANV